MFLKLILSTIALLPVMVFSQTKSPEELAMEQKRLELCNAAKEYFGTEKEPNKVNQQALLNELNAAKVAILGSVDVASADAKATSAIDQYNENVKDAFLNDVSNLGFGNAILNMSEAYSKNFFRAVFSRTDSKGQVKLNLQPLRKIQDVVTNQEDPQNPKNIKSIYLYTSQLQGILFEENSILRVLKNFAEREILKNGNNDFSFMTQETSTQKRNVFRPEHIRQYWDDFEILLEQEIKSSFENRKALTLNQPSLFSPWENLAKRCLYNSTEITPWHLAVNDKSLDGEGKAKRIKFDTERMVRAFLVLAAPKISSTQVKLSEVTEEEASDNALNLYYYINGLTETAFKRYNAIFESEVGKKYKLFEGVTAPVFDEKGRAKLSVADSQCIPNSFVERYRKEKTEITGYINNFKSGSTYKFHEAILKNFYTIYGLLKKIPSCSSY